MTNTRRSGVALLAAAMMLTIACGDDDPTGPTFPTLPQQIVELLCIRGNGQPGETKSGTIAETDCDVNDVDETDVGYFESWRVRVGSSRDVTFSASSAFDNRIGVFELVQSGGTFDILPVGFDDDSGTGTNALLTVPLERNRDYLVAVAGFDYGEIGSYTLAIQ